MAPLHELAAQIALVLTVVGAAWAVTLAVTRRRGSAMLYGELVWVVIAVAVAGLAGVVTALAVRPPADPLHVLYGLLAAAVLPGAALIARDRPSTQRTPILAVGLVVLLILVARLFQTGG